MSSVTLQAWEDRGEPGLARCLLGDDQRQALAFPKHHLCFDVGGNLVLHGHKDKYLPVPVFGRIEPSSFPKIRLAAQSAPHRNATAAATGPTHGKQHRQRAEQKERRQEGVGFGDGALRGQTPKISTGMASGRTRTEASNPPRGRPAATRRRPRRSRSAPACRPAASASPRRCRRVHVQEQAEQRRGDDERQPLASQWPAFTSTVSASIWRSARG